jgi:hypothetical protein
MRVPRFADARVAAILLWLVSSSTPAADSENQYSIKRSDPEVGSNIRKDAVRWTFPLNKTWEQLTTDERARVRGSYISLAESDEPPFPLEGYAPLLKDVGRIQQKALVTGRAMLIARIDANGEPQTISVFETPDQDISKALAHAIMRTKFKPAICAGAPCAMDYPFLFDFSVR